MLPWLFLTLVSLIALLIGEYRDRQALKSLAKPLASTGFVGLAVAAGAMNSIYGRAVLAALVLSWLGDVFLLSTRPKPFLLGLTAFLLAHVAYIVAFVAHGQDPGWSLLALITLLVPAGIVLRWLWPHLQAGMRAPVVAYIAVITTMVAVAAGTLALGAHASLAIGALAFYLSDLAVARDRFVAPGFVNRAWGLPLYYCAQLCLAWSVQT